MQEESLRKEIADVEKELAPEAARYARLKGSVESQREKSNRYSSEIETLQQEINNLLVTIEDRKAEVENHQQQLVDKIKQIEMTNNQIRSEIAINKSNHKKYRDDAEKHLRNQKLMRLSLGDKLSKLKNDYEIKKTEQAGKLRKMENKSKMFLGILKH
jgi:chromosome segregation ATPase